jgi:transposase-like protein
MAKGKSRYTPEPKVSVELKERVNTVMEALAGTITMSEGARRLGMSRNHFQTIAHRGLGGLIESVTPQAAGRPAISPSEREQQERIDRLQRENEALKQRVENFDRLLMVAGDVLRGRIPTSRPRTTKTKAETIDQKTSDEDEDPERSKREQVESMLSLGLHLEIVAALFGLSEPTLRRWLREWKAGTRSDEASRGSLTSRLTDAQIAAVERLVRETHGMIGAEGLKRRVPGVSRRQAAEIKRRTKTAMEQERIAETARVTVRAPGVMRAFDQLYVPTPGKMLTLLVASDAAVPRRTSITVNEHYDAASVAATLENDFAENGAPLVIRMDNAAVHDAPAVREVLNRYRVVLLHGPVQHPRYNGQLERQNREHREWLRPLGMLAANDVAPTFDAMKRVLNEVLPRRRLGWATAEEAWQSRRVAVTDADRDALRDAIEARRTKLRAANQREKMSDALIERLAIEQALAAKGWIECAKGGCAR